MLSTKVPSLLKRIDWLCPWTFRTKVPTMSGWPPEHATSDTESARASTPLGIRPGCIAPTMTRASPSASLLRGSARGEVQAAVRGVHLLQDREEIVRMLFFGREDRLHRPAGCRVVVPEPPDDLLIGSDRHSLGDQVLLDHPEEIRRCVV